jgi:hypothetical protein
MPTLPDSSPTDNLPILFQPGEDLNILIPEVFHTSTRQCYATIPVGDHSETWLITSAEFKHLIHRDHYKAYGKPITSKKLNALIAQLISQALFDGQNHTVHVRVAHKGRKIYIDLANAKWQVVEITSSGWQVVDNPPVKFWRPMGLSPLTTPMPGGSLEDLRPFINCRDEEWPLVVGWLLGAFSRRSYPVMVLQGEQGTAKSTAASILKKLVDPSLVPRSTIPNTEDNLLIAAINSWCLSFDNMSGISARMSDAFCKLLTGGGLRTRRFYTNREEIILKVKRPVILNGIDSLLQRGDLASRAILLELPRIPDESRRTEEDLWREFKTVSPGILGALFTALSVALANIHKVNLDRPPRMADFATWVVAAEPALPWEPGTFLEAYEQNREGVVETSLEADPVAMAVIELMTRGSWVRDTWEGPAARLLETLKSVAGENTGRGWPTEPNVLTRQLNRSAPFLAKKGIEVDTKRFTSTGRKIIITKVS